MILSRTYVIFPEPSSVVAITNWLAPPALQEVNASGIFPEMRCEWKKVWILGAEGIDVG